MNENDARAEFYAMLWAAWQAFAPAAAQRPDPPLIIWDGQALPTPPPQDEAWARVTLRHVTGRQASFTPVGGLKRFERSGILTVQCFGPHVASGTTVARALALVAKAAFEGRGSPSGGWFKNCRVTEIGPDGPWFNVNAVIEFTYHELRLC